MNQAATMTTQQLNSRCYSAAISTRIQAKPKD